MRKATRNGRSDDARGERGGESGMKGQETNRAGRAVPGAARDPAAASVGVRNVRCMAPIITASMVARSHGLAEPRWSPWGRRVAWLDAFDGRADIVVAELADDG